MPVLHRFQTILESSQTVEVAELGRCGKKITSALGSAIWVVAKPYHTHCGIPNSSLRASEIILEIALHFQIAIDISVKFQSVCLSQCYLDNSSLE